MRNGAIMRGVVGAGAALLALAASAAAQRIVPRERTMTVTAQAGQELRVQNYASWDRDCQPLPPPRIVIQTPPAHGTLAIRPGQSTVSVIREGTANCAGHQYPATTIWYLPAPGYAGPDQFAFDVVSTRSTAHDTVVATVRP